MISDASHELRTPLAVLVAQLDEAKRLSANPAAQSSELINAAHTAARLSRMTTNMLELSRLDAHRETATASQQELALELSQSTDRARIVGHPRDVSVDFEISENALGARFAISAVNFGGLVDNLFANAIAASGRRTAVRATLAFESGELRLAVIDEGVGMPEEFMPIAFDRFSRPEKARPTHDRGSGLGLSIVAKIVDRGGGQITLRNLVPGLGVFITLPAVAADSTGPEMPTRRGPST
jgi:signal transduction histidine kinase